MLDECFVLIPCTTLEDFPKQTTDAHAEGLLAAWTAPWHPRLIAAMGKLPQWFRADTLPPVLSGATLLVPEASQKRLPSRFAAETEAAEDCRVIHANGRGEFLAALLDRLGGDGSDATLECVTAERTILADDFFALGYAWLQVQLMTRRLRYTSNLDEIYFAGRVVAAATAMVEGRGEDAATALHEAFDCLAEERDHYFSSDPHLVDLTLLATTTLGPSLGRELDRVGLAGEPPINFLIDTPLAGEIAASTSEPCKRLAAMIDQESVGVAGGGPSADVNLHHMTGAAAEQAVRAARRQWTSHLGDRCVVYARPAGETPGDIGSALAQAGFRGAIPIDLAAGTGWREESKLIWQSAPADLDALLARPIDASQSVGFLSLAPDLGTSIDSGEIATALLVHWPDAQSDAYRDLRRAASWGLVLGKFWKIDDYFCDGERPFHHYRGRADEGAGNWLRRVVDAGAVDPLSTAAAGFLNQVVAETAGGIDAMAALVNPQLVFPTGVAGSVGDAAKRLDDATGRLCVALGGGLLGGGLLGGGPVTDGATAAEKAGEPAGLFVVNPHPISLRIDGRVAGGPRSNSPVLSKQIFRWTAGAGGCDVTADVAGGGFIFLDGSGKAPGRSWFKRSRRLAAGTRLSNEFMEVEVSPVTGGIQGVYSGQGRGNRYSLRLAYVDSAKESGDEMVADSVEMVHGDAVRGEIRATGKVLDAAGQPVATFVTVYRLTRGSRWLGVSTRLTPTASLELGEDPWKSYFALRSAVASDALNLFVPLRDQLHRVGTGKLIDSPGGVVIDEAERQTLLFADGRPAHRKVGDRFIDSLLIVRGETARDFNLSVGFDVRRPAASLRAAACPPSRLAVRTVPSSPVGWLVNCPTDDVVLADVRPDSADPLVVSMLVITTRPESRKVKLRFCRDCESAEIETGNVHAPRKAVKYEGDRVDLSMAGHETLRLWVTLKA